MALLELKQLQINFGKAQAVARVDLDLHEKEMLAIVGESGSGKSLTALSLLNLIRRAEVKRDLFRFLGRDLRNLSEREWCQIRGREIGMIFQEPMTSLNPLMPIGEQIAESIRLHLAKSFKEAKHMAIEMLERVRIPAASQRYDEYPHQMSGGMRQRVMIAVALACRPKILIADEPTTALDVTIQAQIMKLLETLRQELGMAVLLISHDLALVGELSDRVMIMYGGRMIEVLPSSRLLSHAQHPYTRALLQSAPRHAPKGSRLLVIPGQVPALGEFPSGCRFRDRCQWARDACSGVEPILQAIDEEHQWACVGVPT